MTDGGLVHLAGQAIRVGSVVRQRCAWCGALIDEMDLEMVAVPEGDPPPWPLNGEGDPEPRWRGLVLVIVQDAEGALPLTYKQAVDDPEDGKVPKGSCMGLPDEATA